MKVSVTFEISDDDLRAIAYRCSRYRKATRQEVVSFASLAFNGALEDAVWAYNHMSENDKLERSRETCH